MTERPAAELMQGPVRTCVGCRRPGARSGLLRIVAIEVDEHTVLTLDPRRSLPGRGAWLHPDLDCLDHAQRRSAFGRSLHLAGPLDSAGISAQVTALLHESTGYYLEPDPGPEHPTSPSSSAGIRATGSGSAR